MNDNFGITLGGEFVSSALQVTLQFPVIVNLTIEYYAVTTGTIEHWLFAINQINNAQPAHSHGKLVIH